MRIVFQALRLVVLGEAAPRILLTLGTNTGKIFFVNLTTPPLGIVPRYNRTLLAIPHRRRNLYVLKCRA